jgi:hypothetical protein
MTAWQLPQVSCLIAQQSWTDKVAKDTIYYIRSSVDCGLYILRACFCRYFDKGQHKVNLARQFDLQPCSSQAPSNQQNNTIESDNKHPITCNKHPSATLLVQRKVNKAATAAIQLGTSTSDKVMQVLTATGSSLCQVGLCYADSMVSSASLDLCRHDLQLCYEFPDPLHEVLDEFLVDPNSHCLLRGDLE